ncbi:bifunctional diguanylate cyclase/phosphodiesterase [Halomicronema sp. CCY15110]|uniref:putative bifunctional diguanylate cyclase/phosphodiesterase n=1 Tax=Halomicronema sp. CCY15110 TaxID=2767773 RepID=UPI00194DCDA3|nr:EAL domain-containing protein [Halomicronema sp. CCY15110]
MPRLATLVNQVRSRVSRWGQSPQQPRVVPQIFWSALRSVLISSTVVASVCLVAQRAGWLEPLELAMHDQWVRGRPALPPDERLLIISIEEADIRRYGWPLSDEVLAAALERLQTTNPSVIGLDLYRDLPVPPGEQALIEELAAPNIIAITNQVFAIPPPPTVPPERVGFNDFTLDTDGVLRRNLMQVGDGEDPYFSFALQVSRLHLTEQGKTFGYNSEALFWDEVVLERLQATDGGYQTADVRGYQILLDYRGAEAIAPTLTLSELLDAPPEALTDLTGRVVLVGSVAPSLKDFLPTPYSAVRQESFQMSGVMVHAQMISHLLDLADGTRSPFRYWSQWQEGGWLLAWAIAGSLLAWRLRRPIVLSIVAIGGVSVIVFTSAGLFPYQVWIPVVGPVLTFIGALGLAMTHRVFYTTSHDALTGALNQNSLTAYLRRSLKQRQRQQQTRPLGVLYVHLDQLGLVNSSLGQTTGNYMWLELMARLRARLPKAAKIARIDEDDCAIVVPADDKAVLETLANQLRDDVAQPITIPPQQSVVTDTNIGIAITQPNYVHTAENLLRDAHTAMFRARSLGQTQYQVFASGMLEASVQRFALEDELRQALADQQFELYYQPIVSLESDRIAGFEALIRWQHPQRGLISPGIFVPLAEETGLIIPLGQWICETACQQAYEWRQQFSDWPLLISINLSGRQFEQPDLVEQLAKIMQDRQLAGLTFKLEVTESMVMGDVEAAIDLMFKLRSLGCKLSLDDFGTGYSSLSYLRRFPIDTLKVDQSFVRNMNSAEDFAIVRTIVDLAHTLGMDVIAEGVETMEDVEALRSLKAEFGQGYYWAKPLPAAAATKFLAQHFAPS